MANYTITKRLRKNTNVYCARVRSKEKGVVTFSKSKTFNSKSAATKWAKELIHKVEHNIDDLDLELMDCTLGTLIDKYLDRKQKSGRPMGRTAVYTLNQVQHFPISKMLVSKIKSKDIINYCLERKSSPSKPKPATISIDISCLRKVLKVAKSIFSIQVNDQAIIDAYPALHDLCLIARTSKRTRRLESNEFEKLIIALKLKEKHLGCVIPYHDIFLISILTCCRIGELCQLKWSDVNTTNQSILVRNRKSPNGSLDNNSVIPLLGDSLNILERQPRKGDLIFPFNPKSITTGFRNTRKKLGINDLRYHDLRREGASRLVEKGYSVEEVARVTGHKDLNILWQVYVNLRPEHFIRK